MKTDYGEHEAKSVIVAAGVKHKHLRFPYEEELTGSGISYCAICDGPFYTGRRSPSSGTAIPRCNTAYCFPGTARKCTSIRFSISSSGTKAW